MADIRNALPDTAVPDTDVPDTDVPDTAWDRRMHTLRETAGVLVRTVAGPLESLTLRAGDCSLEIVWQNGGTSGGGTSGGGTSGGKNGLTGATAAAPEPVAEPAAGTDRHAGCEAVTAPLVGTFYLASAPGAPPFVQVGDVVESGQTVGIVEAMKLMNHIDTETPGEVVRVLVSDGDSVEFGQPLMLIRPAGHGQATSA